jgi:hypothetical protein
MRVARIGNAASVTERSVASTENSSWRIESRLSSSSGAAVGNDGRFVISAIRPWIAASVLFALL